MMRYTFAPITIFLTLTAPNAAFAHAGHVTDLAGHSHWIGWAALAGSAAIGAAIARGKSRKAKNSGKAKTKEAKTKEAKANA